MRYYLTDDIVPVVPFCLKVETYNLLPNQKCGETHMNNFRQNLFVCHQKVRGVIKNTVKVWIYLF